MTDCDPIWQALYQRDFEQDSLNDSIISDQESWRKRYQMRLYLLGRWSEPKLKLEVVMDLSRGAINDAWMPDPAFCTGTTRLIVWMPIEITKKCSLIVFDIATGKQLAQVPVPWPHSAKTRLATDDVHVAITCDHKVLVFNMAKGSNKNSDLTLQEVANIEVPAIARPLGALYIHKNMLVVSHIGFNARTDSTYQVWVMDWTKDGDVICQLSETRTTSKTRNTSNSQFKTPVICRPREELLFCSDNGHVIGRSLVSGRETGQTTLVDNNNYCPTYHAPEVAYDNDSHDLLICSSNAQLYKFDYIWRLTTLQKSSGSSHTWRSVVFRSGNIFAIPSTENFVVLHRNLGQSQKYYQDLKLAGLAKKPVWEMLFSSLRHLIAVGHCYGAGRRSYFASIYSV